MELESDPPMAITHRVSPRKHKEDIFMFQLDLLRRPMYPVEQFTSLVELQRVEIQLAAM